MNRIKLTFVSLVFCITAFTLWNCNSPQATSLTTMSTMNVALPVSGGHNDAFAVSNDILEYVVTGPGMATINGNSTFTSSSVVAGTVNFTVNVPAGPQRVLAVEVKDAQSNQPLALGAVQFDISKNISSASQIVELGSLTRNCYMVNNPASAGETQTIITGTYSFANDLITPSPYTYGPGWDIQFTQDPTFGGFYFNDAGSSLYPGYYADIAYMGNGDLVNFAYIPNSSFFNAYSSNAKQIVLPQPTATPYPAGTVLPSLVTGNRAGNIIAMAANNNQVYEDLAVGDVYCIQLQSIPGAYAWVQITNAGVQGVSGPSFIYRACSTSPFFAFQRTGIDNGSSVCAGN